MSHILPPKLVPEPFFYRVNDRHRRRRTRLQTGSGRLRLEPDFRVGGGASLPDQNPDQDCTVLMDSELTRLPGPAAIAAA